MNSSNDIKKKINFKKIVEKLKEQGINAQICKRPNLIYQ